MSAYPDDPLEPLMSAPSTARYTGLDGLRALAVGLVIVYHLFPAWALHSGFIGVDVFFVISGFLITSLLLRERAATGRTALTGFWVRRARRLLPALAVVVTVSATAAWILGGDVLVGIPAQVLGAATFSYNWVSIGVGTSYFAASTPELFRNLWSLAVEEQFYLLWPLLLPLFLLLRRRSLRVAAALLLGAGSAGWAFAAMLGGADASRVYYGTDTHAFGLLLGVALAFALYGKVARHSIAGLVPAWGAVIGTASLVTIVVLATTMPTQDAATFPGLLLVASVLSAIAIACAVWPGSWFGRALDAQPLRWIGQRSYGLYLWHWPIVVLLTYATTGMATDAGVPVAVGIVTLVLTVMLAELSYRYVEQPVRRYGFRGVLTRMRDRMAATPAQRFRAIAAGTAIVIALGGTSAAVAAAPRQTSGEAVVAAGQAALDAARDGEAASGPGAQPPHAGGTVGHSALSSARGLAAAGIAGGLPGSPVSSANDVQSTASPTPTVAPVPPGSDSAAVPPGCPTGPLPGPVHSDALTSSGDDAGTSAGDDAGTSAGDARSAARGAVDPAPCPPRDTKPQPPALAHVSGDRVTAVGDSVMLASAGGLLDAFPGIHIDAEVSRSIYTGPGILRDLAASGGLRDYVVVGLGTNGPVDADSLQEMYDIVGPKRHLILVNAFAPRNWIDGVNADLAAFAASRPGVAIADWAGAIAPQTDLLAGDDIHPGAAGGRVFADTVAGAVDGIENAAIQKRYRVDLMQWELAQTLPSSEVTHEGD